MRSSGQDFPMRRIVPVPASVAIVLVVAGLGACDTETDPGSPVPTGIGPGESGYDTTLTGSLPSQMTAAPNPAAGGDGAPAPASSTP